MEAYNEPTEDKSDSKSTFDRSVYADKDFWNFQFKDGGKMFDWYINWKELKKIFLSLMLPKSARILVVGCGNSSILV